MNTKSLDAPSWRQWTVIKLKSGKVNMNIYEISGSRKYPFDEKYHYLLLQWRRFCGLWSLWWVSTCLLSAQLSGWDRSSLAQEQEDVMSLQRYFSQTNAANPTLACFMATALRSRENLQTNKRGDWGLERNVFSLIWHHQNCIRK